MKKYQLFTTDCPAHNKEAFYRLYRTLMIAGNMPISETGFDEWFERCVAEGIIILAETDEA